MSGGNLRDLGALQAKHSEQAIAEAKAAAIAAGQGYKDKDAAPPSGKVSSMSISSPPTNATGGTLPPGADPKSSKGGPNQHPASAIVSVSDNDSASTSAFRSLGSFKRQPKKATSTATPGDDDVMETASETATPENGDVLSAEEAANKAALLEKKKAEREKKVKDRQAKYIRVINSIAESEDAFKALLKKSHIEFEK